MATGIIKKKMDKGFGFIKPDDGTPDVFFHSESCGGQFNSLQEGQQVQFDLGQGPKGPNATNVVAI
jgi:cold shock protein